MLFYTLKRILQPILVVLVVGIVVTTTSQVVSRYVFGSPLIWTEEVARYLGIWLVMLGTGLVLGENMHVGIDYVLEKAPPKLNVVLSTVSLLATFLFSLALVVYGSRLVFAVRNAQTAALRISMGWVYLAVPVGGALLAVYALFLLISTLRKGAKKASEESETAP